MAKNHKKGIIEKSGAMNEDDGVSKSPKNPLKNMPLKSD